MVDCRCGGTPSLVLVNRGGRCTSEERPCEYCGGTGQITEAQSEAIKGGAEYRRLRLERRESLKEAAERHGVTPSDISRMESGLVSAPVAGAA